MNGDGPEVRDLMSRVERLERQNRWLKRAGVAVMAVVGAVLLMGQAAPVPKTTRARRFVLEDAQGKTATELAVFHYIGGTGSEFRAPRNSKPVVVGMVALLAAPHKYDGKVIQTRGFLNLRYESDSLWFHREDLRASLLKNSFALELTQKQREQFKSLNHTYVMVQGTLHSKGLAGPSLESGTISDITMVHGWMPYAPFAPKKKR